MTYTEIINVTGIYDNDVYNAASESERKDSLLDDVCKEIMSAHGFSDGFYKHIFEFSKVCGVMERFGFRCAGVDEENEIHIFVNENTADEISICPVIFYTGLAKFRFSNILIN